MKKRKKEIYIERKEEKKKTIYIALNTLWVDFKCFSIQINETNNWNKTICKNEFVIFPTHSIIGKQLEFVPDHRRTSVQQKSTEQTLKAIKLLSDSL